jgi:hypothetical protein
MIRPYLVDGQQVTVSWVWVYRQHPPVHTSHVAGTTTAGSVERTTLGRHLAVDDQRRLLGSFPGLREAVEHVIREEPR